MKPITTPGGAQLAYLEAGDTYALNDVYEANGKVLVIDENGAGTKVTENHARWYGPRRYIPVVSK